MPGFFSTSETAWSARVPPRRRRRPGLRAAAARGATGTTSPGAGRPARAAGGDFATQLGEGALEALALIVELGEALLDHLTRLVQNVAGVRHFFPFIPVSFVASRVVSFCLVGSVTQSQ